MCECIRKTKIYGFLHVHAINIYVFIIDIEWIVPTSDAATNVPFDCRVDGLPGNIFNMSMLDFMCMFLCIALAADLTK
jgi:hypothetical protein